MSFREQLKPASIGGVRFAVLTAGGKFGRRQAVHEYPFREVGWIEDTGKALRRLEITGFLLEDDLITGGADVIEQRNALIAVAESPNPVTLDHPTYGTWQINIQQVEIIERWDQGRYFEIFFKIIEAGQRVFPTIAIDYASALEETGLAAYVATLTGYVTDAIRLVHKAAWVIRTAKATVLTWLNIGYGVVNDATNLYSLCKSLGGPYGRFYGGNAFTSVDRPKRFVATAQATPRTVAESGATSRGTVHDAASDLSAAADTLDVAAIGQGVQAVVAAIVDSVTDPAERLRLLAELAGVSSMAELTAQDTITIALMRRAALVAMATTCGAVQPQSADEAETMRDMVVANLDRELIITGDSGEDDIFSALLDLRRVVILAMNEKGASLPTLKRFSFTASLPAEVIALRVYRNPARGDEVAMQSGAPHPAFQPAAIQLLSS